MNIETVKQLATNWGKENSRIRFCPPEAKYVTGNQQIDSMLYYFQNESGLEVSLTEKKQVASYEIIDSAKLTLFILRWL